MKLLQKVSSLFIFFTIVSSTSPSFAQSESNRIEVIDACSQFDWIDAQEACLKSGINDASIIEACRQVYWLDEQISCLSSNAKSLQNRRKWMYFSLDGFGNFRNVGFLEMFGNSGLFYVTFNNGKTVTQQMTLKKAKKGGVVLAGKIIASDSRSYVPDKLYLDNLLKKDMSGKNCDGVNDCVDFKLVYLGSNN